MSKTVIHTPNAPAAIGPYSQATCINNLIYTSGQLGMNPTTGEMLDGINAQATQVMENLGAILKEAGSDFNHVIKSLIFVTDLADFATVNSIYQSYFSGDFPARSCVQVAKLPKDGLVEIEVIAEKI